MEEEEEKSYDVVANEDSTLSVVPTCQILPSTQSTDNFTLPDPQRTIFGEYIRKSRACNICRRRDHMEINYMRARDHLTYQQIMQAKGVSPDDQITHFKNHYIISKHNQDIINLKENTSQEANDIVTRILEGDLDLFGGAHSVLKSKVQRLNGLNNRRKALEDTREDSGNLTPDEQDEFLLICKLSEEIENSMTKILQIIDKKAFPTGKDDLAKAMLSYKHSVLTKFVDDIAIVLIEFERNPLYTGLIQQIRLALSQRVSALEAKILSSGGVLKPLDEDDMK